MREIVLLVHDVRSTHNVGSLLRTADGFGVSHVYFSGYTPYPPLPHDDNRLPHIANKLGQQINKTALGAELTVKWSQTDSVAGLIEQLKTEGFSVVALEQNVRSVTLPDYNAPEKVAVLLGREVEGIAVELLQQADDIIEIPMLGNKESFNVVQAAAIALYHLRFSV